MPFCLCGEEINPKRYELGYKTCIDCGSPPVKFIVVPVPKSNYVVGTMQDLEASYKNKGQSYA